MKKLLLSGSLLLAWAMVLGPLARAEPDSAIPHPAIPQAGQQSQQATQSVAGTVTSIEDGGRSFSLAVENGSDKKTIKFVLDKDSQVQGQVKVGTSVTVDYVAMADQLVARTVTAQG
jgi:hypothetical protein